MPVLNFVKGANQGQSVTLDGERIVLGRNADCTVVLNVPAVSREHAVIKRVQGKYYIEDLKSRNGTFVNNKEVSGSLLLNDNDQIKICDNIMSFFAVAPKKALPEDLRRAAAEAGGDTDEEDESSSTVEATISSSRQVLETQPAEKLAFLVDVGAELAQTLNLEDLLPKIVEKMFQVFRQADRCFIIMGEEGTDKLIPKVIKTRRANDDEAARFSRRIVHRCMETAQALLSEDATADKRFDLSQSIADCKIRSVMLSPLVSRTTGKAIGVIQLDTQDRFKKFTQDDLKLLMAVASQAAVALENAKMHETLLARADIERKLKTARQVQISFLPKKPPEVPGYEFFAHYESALEVGGDYYDFVPLSGGRIAAMIGDVAGKGVDAALLMAKVSADARFVLLTEPTLADSIYKLNEFMQEAGTLDKFVTLEACLIDPSTHKVTIVNAGHNPPILYRKATGKIEEAMARDIAGFPLGVADGIPFEAVEVELQPGDCMVTFTDGVSEAQNKEGKDFGFDRVNATLEAGPRTPKAMCERLVAAVKQYAVGCKQHDDITVVCFGRTG